MHRRNVWAYARRAKAAIYYRRLYASTDAEARRRAGFDLGRTRVAWAISVLTPFVSDADFEVRSTAVSSMLDNLYVMSQPARDRIGDKIGASLLAQFEAEPNPWLKMRIAGTLGFFRYRPAIPVFISALENDGHPLIRQGVAQALKDIESEGGLPVYDQQPIDSTDSHRIMSHYHGRYSMRGSPSEMRVKQGFRVVSRSED